MKAAIFTCTKLYRDIRELKEFIEEYTTKPSQSVEVCWFDTKSYNRIKELLQEENSSDNIITDDYILNKWYWIMFRDVDKYTPVIDEQEVYEAWMKGLATEVVSLNPHTWEAESINI